MARTAENSTRFSIDSILLVRREAIDRITTHRSHIDSIAAEIEGIDISLQIHLAIPSTETRDALIAATRRLNERLDCEVVNG